MDEGDILYIKIWNSYSLQLINLSVLIWCFLLCNDLRLLKVFNIWMDKKKL